MKNAIICLLFILSSCLSNSLATSNQFLVTQLEENKYAVIFIETEKTDSANAREQALQQAAQITHDKGFQFFKVESEQNVVVQRSPDSRLPPAQNIYQEYIQDQRFGKSDLETMNLPQKYPGKKIVFSCYTEDPPYGAIEACTLIHCEP